MSSLIDDKLSVINLGVPSFADALVSEGVESVHLDWRPPAPLPRGLEKISAADKSRVKQANQQAVSSLLAATPNWVGMGPALELIPGMQPNLILHSGPPITWEKMY